MKYIKLFENIDFDNWDYDEDIPHDLHNLKPDDILIFHKDKWGEISERLDKLGYKWFTDKDIKLILPYRNNKGDNYFYIKININKKLTYFSSSNKSDFSFNKIIEL